MNEEPPQKRAIAMFLRWFGYLVIGSAIVVVGLLSFWNIQNPQVILAKNTPFPVRPPENSAGNVEYVHIDYCKNVKAQGAVSLRMIGRKSIIRIPFPADNSNPQCLDTEIPIVLPTYAVDDVYYFDFTIVYRINPIKTTTVELKSQPFTVANKLMLGV